MSIVGFSRTRLVASVACAALALVSADDLHAQSHAAIGLGGSVTVYRNDDPRASGHVKVGPLIRLRTGPGLGPAVGFEWLATDVSASFEGELLPLGRLSIRPFMGGIGYSVERGRWQVSVSLVGGYAFAGIKVNDRTRAAYRDSRGGTFASVLSNGSFAWRPKVALWYDAAERVGVTVGVGYLGVRPSIDLVTDLGQERMRVRASSVVLTAGVAYGIF